MSSSQLPITRVVPAHLDFLAIYNPRLGAREHLENDQIVFYWSNPSSPAHKGQEGEADAEQTARERSNEQLRQVGLAQGVIHFANDFSNGSPVDSIDTEKHRIVLQELEEGWWVLVSINLTVLPSNKRVSAETHDSPTVEYSAREVSSPALVSAQLRSAHSVFQLHHGPSLTRLYERIKRSKFCNLLDIYWSTFALDWDVMLHGNPAADIYNGVKLAAGGELGFGVGEEEWGSGEREVLEGIIRDEDGLFDLIVSRFGHASTGDTTQTVEQGQDDCGADDHWLGSLLQPEAIDGIIFSGGGAVSRASLCAISNWMSSIYTYGEGAYGIKDNPTSGRRRGLASRGSSSLSTRQRSQGDSRTALAGSPLPAAPWTPEQQDPLPQPEEGTDGKSSGNPLTSTPSTDERSDQTQSQLTASGPTIPRPIVSAAEDALKQATERLDINRKENGPRGGYVESESKEGWTRYLTLGYGSSWTIPGLQKESPRPAADSIATRLPEPPHEAQKGSGHDSDRRGEPKEGFIPPTLPISDTVGTNPPLCGGKYLVGLSGSLDRSEVDANDTSEDEDSNNRLVVRTLHVEVPVPVKAPRGGGSTLSSSQRDASAVESNASLAKGLDMRRLRVVVYVNRPFIFTFLFDPNSPRLSMPSFFRKMHQNLLPLQRPLLASTSPSNVASRLSSSLVAPSPHQDRSRLVDSPIFDLIYDPYNLTVHTSIPNIPLPGTFSAEALPAPTRRSQSPRPSQWTRVEALSVHSQILNAFAETRRQDGNCELQTKTSRAWWIVWMRLTAAASEKASPVHQAGRDCGEGFREAILIRRAGDRAAAQRGGDLTGQRKASGVLSRWTREVRAGSSTTESGGGNVESGSGFGWGPGRITEGLGVDARKYVESLLSLSR